MIAWTSLGQDPGDTPSQGGVYAQRFAADGTAVGPEFRVNTRILGIQKSPTVAMDADGDFVIAYSAPRAY